MSVALMYHDVVDEGSSGFETPGADDYKLDVASFDAHLDAIERHATAAPGVDLSRPGLRLTFDDGGQSAHSVIAQRLEARGWRGFFFVTGSRVGTPGFLDADQIRDLDRRGHVIGSHSQNHPLQMARLSAVDIRSEWGESCDALATIVSHRIEVASIPGGMYSGAVARAAADSGVFELFTSEPRRRSWHHGDCRLHGRYAVVRSTSPSWVGGVVAGARWPRYQQRARWEVVKVAKRVLGPFYLGLRDRLRSRSD